jgi:hypothetical protein
VGWLDNLLKEALAAYTRQYATQWHLDMHLHHLVDVIVTVPYDITMIATAPVQDGMKMLLDRTVEDGAFVLDH